MRPALVEEGLALLAEKGGDGFSLRELARRVGVTANASYRHFANKEALMLALAAEGFRRLRATQEAAEAAADSPGRKLVAGGLGYLRFAHANPALFRLMFGARAAARRGGDNDDPELADASFAAFETLRQAVARVVDADQATVSRTALRAWAMVHGFSQLLLDGQLDHLGADPLAEAEVALTDAIRAAGPV
ncbi:TetR/AcrR family transcriptional regulator [Alloalcanivorax gelatiniphagus]|uniref:TetR/AcrR family transcriptional regulator n=1 Tax=Alloalcanivorax gelatiniphagus TaxID=1194167 RepID=A0ABY2XIC0_9GAMM|nr:TetR/AcrR family transcriptional regulator [Alloalcanivorax gelatiniphagus]